MLDQFEELFSHTGGSADRIARVFDDLATLIENRIPAELAGDAATERRSQLDLLCQGYRVVLSFREDYLPDVKTWERKVPSLRRNNYLRLEPLTRRHAIEAVELAGSAMLEKGVAPVIVDFVGKLDTSAALTENNRAGIEPALLSLFCYQLNRRRRDKPIDEALIAKSGREILDHFYCDTLEAEDVKGPPDVARFIQDNLVQGDRFRGLFPRDEALKENFLTRQQLDALTARHRLLRVVEYAGIFRIELIHDCLVPVVCRARDDRKNREQQAELERKAREADARARERQKRIFWLRAALVLMGVLLAFALWEWNQAIRAEHQATRAENRAIANTAVGASYRTHFEKKEDMSALFASQALALGQSLQDPLIMARAENQLRRALNSRLLRNFRHTEEVNAVAFSPDGHHLVSASAKRQHIWNLETGSEEPTAERMEHRGNVKTIAFTANGILMAGDNRGDLRLWDPGTGDEKPPPNPMRQEPGISAVASGAGNLVAGAVPRSGDNLLWDMATGRRLGTVLGQDGEGSRWFNDLDITKDGTRLAAADVSSGRTTVWDIGTPKSVAAPIASFSLKNWRLDLDPAADPKGMLVNSVAFSRDGQLLATGDRFNSANLWDGKTGEHRAVLAGHRAQVRKVALDHDGSRLATASEDSTAAVWDTVSGKQLFTLVGHKYGIRDLDFSPWGSRLATAGGKDRTAKVWDAEAHTGVVYGAAFSPDNRYLATAGSDKTIRVWDVKSRELVARLIGHQGPVKRIVFSPDRQRLASASHDETARIWNWSPERVTEVRALQYADEHFGDDKFNDVAYSPDGEWLATACANYNAVLWDAAAGRREFARRHNGMVWAVAFSPDGKYLASAGDDGLMKLWDVP